MASCIGLKSRLEALSLAAAMLVLAPAALAHEWYTRECCGDMDCAPVERAEALPDGGLRVTSRVGTTVVPASFPRQESPDAQMHVCMVRYSHFDDMRPVCFFVPPTPTPPPS
jgi:hypothetical protein